MTTEGTPLNETPTPRPQPRVLSVCLHDMTLRTWLDMESIRQGMSRNALIIEILEAYRKKMEEK